MRKGTRQEIKTAGEYDELYGRRVYCYLQRPGVSRELKRQLARRRRREAEEALRAVLGEEAMK